MVDIPQTPPDIPSQISTSKGNANLQVDPKLLTKALKKMQGLVNGNGLDPDKVTLCDAPEDTLISMYRFNARTSLKLVPQYGIKIEAGKNTVAELMPSEAEFKRAISNIAIQARTDSLKRQQIIDVIFNRSDKGFGIKEQRIKLQSLNRDFVQHEKCQPCGNTGRTKCGRCGGVKTVTCPKCQGRKFTKCPKCRGTSKVQTSQGPVPCLLCRGDGRISCRTCTAHGFIKCPACAAAGSMPCRQCAATGWMSHLAHVEVHAQVKFNFDEKDLPLLLAGSLKKNPSRCVEKHEIEVSIKKPTYVGQILFDKNGQPINTPATDIEPDDTIWIDYEAISPFGPIAFTLDHEKVGGHLFGFQTRLIEFPPFLDKLTEEGQKALIQSSLSPKSQQEYLKNAARFRFVKDMIVQTMLIKDIKKAKLFLREKYITGVEKNNIDRLVDAADLALGHITRMWRVAGLIIGMVFFTLIVGYYFIGEARLSWKLSGVPEILLALIDIALIPIGAMIGTFSSKYIAKWSQNKALEGIIDAEILKATLPKAGKTVQWSMIASCSIVLIMLGGMIWGGYVLPDWLQFIATKIHAIGLSGL